MTRSVARLIAVPVLMCVFQPTCVHAWSGGGHEAICQIALLEVSPAVRKKIKKIMAREKDAQFKTFAAACTWPDSQKHTSGTIQNQRKDEHFVNVARDLQAITSEDCGVAQKCLFTAIHADEDALKNSSGTDQLIALKFLGHWVGDLHQPLHISYADDLGGNDIPVSAAAGCKELHAVWDQCIPEELRQQIGANAGATDFGTKLQKEITDAERTAWRQGTLVDWAAESYAITRKPDTKYCLLQGSSCCYDTASCENTGDGTPSLETKRLASLPHSYDDGEVATVKEQLKKAGVRLAAILDAELQ